MINGWHRVYEKIWKGSRYKSNFLLWFVYFSNGEPIAVINAGAGLQHDPVR